MQLTQKFRSPRKGETIEKLARSSKVSGFDGAVVECGPSAGQDHVRSVATVTPNTTHVPVGLGRSLACVSRSHRAGWTLGKTYVVRAWLACSGDGAREMPRPGSGWSTASASPVPGVALQGCRPAGQLPGGDGDPRHPCIHARSSIGAGESFGLWPRQESG